MRVKKKTNLFLILDVDFRKVIYKINSISKIKQKAHCCRLSVSYILKLKHFVIEFNDKGFVDFWVDFITFWQRVNEPSNFSASNDTNAGRPRVASTASRIAGTFNDFSRTEIT